MLSAINLIGGVGSIWTTGECSGWFALLGLLHENSNDAHKRIHEQDMIASAWCAQ